MSLWKIALRSVQQRWVASMLTMLSMALGVMSVVVVLTVHGVLSESFRSNSTLGYNMIVGAKGGSLQLTLNTVYFLSQPVENIPYDYYLAFQSAALREAEMAHSYRYQASQVEWDAAEADMLSAFCLAPGLSSIGPLLALEAAAEIDESSMGLHEDGKFSEYVKFAIPLCLGDYYGNFRVVGTTPAFFKDVVFDPERDRRYEVATSSDLKAAENTYRRLDSNEDGIVQLDELPIPAEMDANGDGIIESYELGTDDFGEPIATPPWLKDLERLLHLADANDDRRLTAEELDACHNEFPRPFQSESKRFGFFEAIVGATVAREMDVQIGQQLAPAHGLPDGDIHENRFTVVGILEPTGTPNDRALFVNMEGFFLMSNHAQDIKPAPTYGDAASETESESEPELEPDFVANRLRLPIEQREVTALLVQTVRPIYTPNLQSGIDAGSLDDTMAWSPFRPKLKQTSAQAVMPVAEIYKLFDIFVTPVQSILLGLTIMICIVSGVSILVSIYNSMSDRRHEIAVMRALGAGRSTVTTTIFLESVILSLGGALIGWVTAHLFNHLISPFIEEKTGVSVHFYQLAPGLDVAEILSPFQTSMIVRIIMGLCFTLVGLGWGWLEWIALAKVKSAPDPSQARVQAIVLGAACGVATLVLGGLWALYQYLDNTLLLEAYLAVVVVFAGIGTATRKDLKWCYLTMAAGYCMPLLLLVTTISYEALVIPGVVLLAMIVGVMPAVAAYRTDVAESLGK